MTVDKQECHDHVYSLLSMCKMRLSILLRDDARIRMRPYIAFPGLIITKLLQFINRLSLLYLLSWSFRNTAPEPLVMRNTSIIGHTRFISYVEYGISHSFSAFILDVCPRTSVLFSILTSVFTLTVKFISIA